MNLQPSQFSEPGLYLILPDGKTLVLTRRLVEERSAAALADPSRIDPSVKEAEAFQLCSICPKRGSGETCHAIRPILACWEELNGYSSHDRVTAVYRDDETTNIVAAETTLQSALQYLSVLSLMQYCETGQKYWQYFYGVHPLMLLDDVVGRVYLNMFWACKGDVNRTRALIGTFREEITITTRCQMERVRLFSSNDSFLNALVLTQLASEFLASGAEDVIRLRLAPSDPRRAS